jgi:RNA polymerase sigma-70 factor (ECF subfamily)
MIVTDMTDTDNDEALMLDYAAGNARAFEILYTRHKGPLYRYLQRQCRGASVAEELFQDVWMNLIRARSRYEPRAKFTTYLYSLAHNRLIDHYRSQSRGLPMSYEEDPEEPLVERIAGAEHEQPEKRVGRARVAQRMLELLSALPEAQREAFLMREEAGLSLEEIAAATGVNVETAKSRLRYAVAKLRRGMGDAGMDET